MKPAGIMGWFSRLLRTTSGRRGETRPTAAAELLPTDTVVIDVRSPGEFASGHVEGAISLPLDRIHAEIDSVVADRKAPLLLYCRSGARSRQACALVSQLGYESVRNGGGIGAVALSLDRPIRRRGG